MIKTMEAVFEAGVFRPVGPIELPDAQRVRLTVEPIGNGIVTDRVAALEKLRRGIKEMNFQSVGPFPSRESLHA